MKHVELGLARHIPDVLDREAEKARLRAGGRKIESLQAIEGLRPAEKAEVVRACMTGRREFVAHGMLYDKLRPYESLLSTFGVRLVRG